MDLGVISRTYDPAMKATVFRVVDYASGRTTYVTIFDRELANVTSTDDYFNVIYKAAEDNFNAIS